MGSSLHASLPYVSSRFSMIPEADTYQSRKAVSDAELLDRARSGDQGAFRTIVQRYEPAVAATVQGMLGKGPEAEDVGQETFIRFYRALQTFREESSLKTYLTRIAINLSLNALKRRRRLRDRFIRQEDESIVEPSISGEAELDKEEEAALIRDAVERLDPKHRAVVVLRMMNGYSTKETAELLGLPQGTVLSRLSRGMKRLETLLKPFVERL